MEKKCLSELPLGKTGRILSLGNDEILCRRLRSLGVGEESRIRPAFTSPFGDPIAYEVQGIVIALRRQDSGQIVVEEESPWG